MDWCGLTEHGPLWGGMLFDPTQGNFGGSTYVDEARWKPYLQGGDWKI